MCTVNDSPVALHKIPEKGLDSILPRATGIGAPDATRVEEAHAGVRGVVVQVRGLLEHLDGGLGNVVQQVVHFSHRTRALGWSEGGHTGGRSAPAAAWLCSPQPPTQACALLTGSFRHCLIIN